MDIPGDYECTDSGPNLCWCKEKEKEKNCDLKWDIMHLRKEMDDIEAGAASITSSAERTKAEQAYYALMDVGK